MIFRVLFLGVLVLCILAVCAPFSTLSVRLSSTAGQEGSIRIAVFDSGKGFENEAPIISKVLAFQDEREPLEYTFNQLPVGSFAVAAYHDLNNDGKLNRNLFGVPVEPYAFSKEPTSKWRAPKWEEILISSEGLDQLNIPLKYWKDR
jgi:uncharacterized protein (DUF2141 family)